MSLVATLCGRGPPVVPPRGPTIGGQLLRSISDAERYYSAAELSPETIKDRYAWIRCEATPFRNLFDVAASDQRVTSPARRGRCRRS